MGMSQQHALTATKANYMLCSIKTQVASKATEVTVPFHSGYCVQAWSSQHKKDIDLLDSFQKRAIFPEGESEGCSTSPVRAD